MDKMKDSRLRDVLVECGYSRLLERTYKTDPELAKIAGIENPNRFDTHYTASVLYYHNEPW